MLSEHEWVYERMRLHTLMKEHPDWGARRLAHALGHDPKWVLKWKSRILSSSKLTLEVFGSQSRAPKHIPRRTSPEAKAIIGELRRELSERYHRPAGARTIQYGISKPQFGITMINLRLIRIIMDQVIKLHRNYLDSLIKTLSFCLISLNFV